ncbi:efflux transporter outer membrane subunit [Erythrobacter sp. Alg231-14]|uniref:efflux transporter outer membrane subunit n=1 Tax=Erythrobacter sp. Alg231-14 TaxID=1922225 RepID=UPI000D5628CF
MRIGTVQRGAARSVTFAPLLALAALSGCALPSMDAPALEQAIPVPERWSIADDAASHDAVAIELGSYWLLLNDPLIDEFTARARQNNFDLAASLARLQAAEARLRDARSARLPTANASGGLRQDFGDFANDDLQYVLNGDVSWETDLFGRISGSIAASRAELRAAGYNAADLERIIVATVATQTITARSLAAQLEIARASLANQDDNLLIAQWRAQAGLVSSLDVEQARTQRAQTAASIPLLEGDLVATANAISTLIGETPGPVYATLVEQPREVPAPPVNVSLKAPADTLRMRPDVGAAEAQLIADLERVGVARAQLYPLVRLTGTVGTSAFGIDELFDVITGNVFAGITQLLFDGGRTRAQIDASQAIADGSLAAWQQSILEALEDVETASVGLSTSNDRVTALMEASEGARGAAILARSQYQAGLIDFQVLLSVESQLLSARTAQVSAEAARASSFVALARAMGGGWRAPQNAGIETGNNGQ